MRKFTLSSLLVISLFFFLPIVLSVSAATFSFDPATVTGTTGKPFQVQLIIDSGTDEITSADAFVTFDKTVLKATDVTEGTFFPSAFKEIKEDQVYVAGMVEDQTQPKKGKGTLATLTFEPLKDGSATLSIDCANSKIIKADASLNAPNVIECTQNGTSKVTIGASSSSGTTTTTNPTGTTSTTSNNSSSNNSNNSYQSTKPAELPKSGVWEDVAKIAIPGAILLFVGSAVRMML